MHLVGLWDQSNNEKGQSGAFVLSEVRFLDIRLSEPMHQSLALPGRPHSCTGPARVI